MASWSQVENHPAFGSLSAEQKRRARETFFQEYVAPQAPSDFYDTLYSEWMQGWRPTAELGSFHVEQEAPEPSILDRLQSSPALQQERSRQQERLEQGNRAAATAIGAGESFVDRTQAAMGGLLSEAGRQVGNIYGNLPFALEPVQQGIESLQRSGEDIAVAETQEAQQSRQRALQQGADALGMDILGALGDLGVQVAATLATRSPTVGASTAAAQVFGPEYARRLQEGQTREEAAHGALLRSGIEVGTTVPALGVFSRLFGQAGEQAASRIVNTLEQSRAGRGLLGGAAEGAQETAAGILGDAADYSLGFSRESPFSGLAENFREGGIGGVVGGIVGLLSPGRQRTGIPAYDAGVESVATEIGDRPRARWDQDTQEWMDVSPLSEADTTPPIDLTPEELANAVATLDPERGRRLPRTQARVQAEGDVLAQMMEEGSAGNNERFAELMADRGFSTPISGTNIPTEGSVTPPETQEVVQPASQVSEQPEQLDELEAARQNVSRIQTQGDVIRQMLEEGYTADTPKRRARFAELMTERGFPTEVLPDAQGRLDRPSQVEPLSVGTLARVQRDGKWTDATVNNIEGDDVSVTFADGSRATYPDFEVERMERRAAMPSESPVSPSEAVSPTEATQVVSEPQTPPQARTEALRANKARNVLAQLREEGRVGDKARFDELMGGEAPPAMSLGRYDAARSINELPASALAEPDVRQAVNSTHMLFKSMRTAKEALTAVKERVRGDERYERLIASLEKNNLDDVGFQVIDPEEIEALPRNIDTDAFLDQNQVPVGVYGPSSNTIYIKGAGWKSNGLDDGTILHEIVHAASLKKIRGVQKGIIKDRATIDAVKELERMQKLFRTRTDDFQQFDPSTRFMLEYAATNPDEFIAVTQTDKTVQAALKEKGLWEKFIDLVRRLLGLSRLDKPLLEQVLETGTRVIEVQPDVIQETSAPAMSVKENPNIQRFAQISERMANPQKRTPEQAQQARESAGDRALVRNLRLNLQKSYPNLSPEELNRLVGERAAETIARREKANERTFEAPVLEAQGSPQGFTKTAKDILRGQSKLAKTLKGIFNYRGGDTKELYRNVYELPGKRMDGVNRQIAFLTRTIEKAMGRDASQELYQEFIKALRGQENSLNKKQLAAVKEARGAIDKLQLELADALNTEDVANQQVLDTLLASLGNYVSVAYRKNHFRPPFAAFRNVDKTEEFLKIRESEAPQIVEKAFDSIRKNYLIPESLDLVPNDKINQLAAEYGVRGESRQTKQQGLERIRSQYETDVALMDALVDELFSAHPVSSLLAVTRQARKNPIDAYKGIPQDIKDAWGEYADPAIVVGSTMIQLAGITNKIKINNWLSEEGKKQGFVFEKRPEGAGKWKQLKSDPRSNTNYGSLEGLWVNQDLKTVIDDINKTLMGLKRDDFSEGIREALNAWGRYNAIPKLTKTALSLPAIVTQAASNLSLSIGEFFSGGKPGEFLKSVMTALRDATFTNDKEAQAFINKMVEMGALRDGLTLGELRGQVRRLERQMEVESRGPAGKAIGRLAIASGRALEKVGDFYQLTDNIPKLFGYLTAVKNLRKIYPEKGTEEIEQMAGDRAMDRYPTFSRAFPVARFASRLMGNYATWPAETVRTLERQITYAFKDAKEAVKLGLDTPSGQAAFRYAIGQALGTTTSLIAQKAILGMLGYGALKAIASQLPGEDEEEKIERLETSISALAPEWLQNTSMRPILLDPEKHRMIVVDEGRVDPFGPVKEAARGTARDGLFGLTEEVAETLFTPGPLLAGIIETATGKELYGFGLGPQKSRLEAATEPFKPGQASAIERTIKSIDAGGDATINWYVQMGMPLRELDGTKLYRSKASEFKQAINQNRQDTVFALQYFDEMPREAVEAIAIQWLQRDKEAWNDARVATEGAKYAFNMDEETISEANKPLSGDGNILSKKRLYTLLDDSYEPLPPSQDTWDNMAARLLDKNKAIPDAEELIIQRMSQRQAWFENVIENWQQYVGE